MLPCCSPLPALASNIKSSFHIPTFPCIALSRSLSFIHFSYLLTSSPLFSLFIFWPLYFPSALFLCRFFTVTLIKVMFTFSSLVLSFINQEFHPPTLSFHPIFLQPHPIPPFCIILSQRQRITIRGKTRVRHKARVRHKPAICYCLL